VCTLLYKNGNDFLTRLGFLSRFSLNVGPVNPIMLLIQLKEQKNDKIFSFAWPIHN